MNNGLIALLSSRILAGSSIVIVKKGGPYLGSQLYAREDTEDGAVIRWPCGSETDGKGIAKILGVNYIELQRGDTEDGCNIRKTG